MNKLVITLFCFLALASKCKKKEPADLLPGNWGILTHKENNTDNTASFNISHQGYKLSFDSRGKFTEFYRAQSVVEVTINGTWTLENNNQTLILVDNDPNSNDKIRTYTLVHEITATALDIARGSEELDLRKQE
jgi:hypothetical protein